jgi:hypothetical protein
MAMTFRELIKTVDRLTKTKMKTKSKTKIKPFPLKYIEAVERGVQWLDLMFGRKEWLKRMDMRLFDIKSGSVCVAGNVFRDAFIKNQDAFNDPSSDDGYGRFVEMMKSMGAPKADERFGFFSESDTGMQHLQDLWVRKINGLKAAQSRSRRVTRKAAKSKK